MSDSSLISFCRGLPNLEHLELTRCEGITEFGIDTIIGVLPSQ